MVLTGQPVGHHEVLLRRAKEAAKTAMQRSGNEDFDDALKLGYVPPKDFHEWGKCFEYKYNSHNTLLPEDVRETWRLYNNTAAIYDKHVTEGPRWMRNALSKAAGWRLETGRYKFPIEQKVFDLYVRATGQTQPGAADYQPVVDA